jgi:hypothetical protein
MELGAGGSQGLFGRSMEEKNLRQMPNMYVCISVTLNEDHQISHNGMNNLVTF